MRLEFLNELWIHKLKSILNFKSVHLMVLNLLSKFSPNPLGMFILHKYDDI